MKKILAAILTTAMLITPLTALGEPGGPQGGPQGGPGGMHQERQTESREQNADNRQQAPSGDRQQAPSGNMQQAPSSDRQQAPSGDQQDQQGQQPPEKPEGEASGNEAANGEKPSEAPEQPSEGQQPGNGQQPENGQRPGNGQQQGNGQMPENGQQPENGQMPGNGQMPENGQMPGNGQMPENGQMPMGGMPGGMFDRGRIDFDALVNDGVISQETRDSIMEYMQSNRPEDGVLSMTRTDGEELTLLDALLLAGVITAEEYEQISAAQPDLAMPGDAQTAPEQQG